MAIEHIFIFFLVSFSLTSPETIYVNESFDVSINSEDSSTYDIKIFIENENEEIISQIYNNGWKNPRYYINSAYPQILTYKIRATSPSENANLCLRWRKPDNTKYDETCQNITVIESLGKNYETVNNENLGIITLNSAPEGEYVSTKEKERSVIFYFVLLISILAILFLVLKLI